jgi:hypothetical protein
VTVWEYSTLVVQIGSGEVSGAEAIWTVKREHGLTDWERVVELGQQGWELVSITPIEVNSDTEQLLYTYKRPKP